MRAAVAGALVRACGDLALPFVQPMLKERDDRALVAMAPELGRLKSPESADLLAKMMARPGGELRLAVTRGLAERKDDPGKALKTKAFESIRHDAVRLGGAARPGVRGRAARRAAEAAARSAAGTDGLSRRCCAPSATARRSTG